MKEIQDAMLVVDGLGFAHLQMTKIDLDLAYTKTFASEAEAREFLQAQGWKAGATIETFFKVVESETPQKRGVSG